MYTIGKLARKFGISRSTLLYYHSVGVLKPSGRGDSNYRLYSEEDCGKLERICSYREAGISIRRIKEIMSSEKSAMTRILEDRLHEINRQIGMLHQQQLYVSTMLQNSEMLKKTVTVDRHAMSELLDSAGISEEARWRFHHEFEKCYPDNHRLFLELIGMNEELIEEVRKWSREDFSERHVTARQAALSSGRE